MRNRILLITSLLTLATLASAQNFVAARSFSLGQYGAKQMAVGDFNGDGQPDVVVPYDISPGQVAVLLNNGDGTFKAPLISNGAGAYPVAIAVGDFNGDGKLDLIVAGAGTKQQGPIVTVLLGKGDGTFQPGQNFALASTPAAILAGDFNNDGKLDVAVSMSAIPNVSILLGNGDGSLQAAKSFSVGTGTALGAGDFNGDGNLDLIIGNSSPLDNVTVALGNGDGTLQPGKNTYLGINVESLAVGDVNHDGKLDIVTVEYGGASAYVNVGNGDGTFQVTTTFPGGSGTQGVTIADVNHDGNLDIVIANTEGIYVVSPALIVLLGKGDGTFEAASGYNVSSGLEQVLVADFNGDGNPDVVATNGQEASITLAIGKGDGTFIAAPTYGVGGELGLGLAADFNNDGILDLAVPVDYGLSVPVLLGNGDGTFQSVTAAPTQPGRQIAVGDFNHDGNLDVASVDGYNGSLLVALGNGNGTFGSGVNYNADSSPDFVATDDLNGDGILDLVIANYSSNDISVLLGKGDGTFGGAANYSANQVAPYGLVLADFNGDGKLDLAVASVGNSAVRGALTVMLGNGDGTFGAPKLYAKDNYSSVIAADMNGDGKLDLVAPGYDPSTKTGFISILLGNGDGTFQKPINTTVTVGSGALLAADYNGDGKLDIAIGDFTGGVNIFPGNGDGTLQNPVTFGAGNAPSQLIGGDFNSDGAPDIAAENYRDNNVSILLNTAGTFITTTSSPNPSGVGQSVAFTAKVKGSINTTTTPTGSVTFYDGSTSLGKVTMTAGSASLSTSTLTTGNHTITASYSGDTNFFAHTGAPLTQSVQSGPLVTLSPTSLTFASQAVGTVSPPQMIILTNSGVSTLTITSIVPSGDYGISSTCPASLAAGKKCSITVSFAPTAAGTRTGTVSVTDNAPGSPQTVSLTGTGIAPSVTLSPTSLTFATQLVSTTSAGQTVTLTNTGTAALTISLISITGTNLTDYLESNTCGSTVAVSGSCTISVAFRPKARGARTASLSIADNAIGSPQTVALSGTGTVVSLSASSINFGTETVGKTSAPNTLTLTNTSQTALTISSIALTGANPGDFAQTNTCGTGIHGGATCTISVTFTPTKKGARSASVSITDSGGGSPQTVSVTGTGN